jgi:Enoyl-CoA hydratase/isomerase
MSNLIQLSQIGDAAIITLNNPPVNAIAAGVPRAIVEAVASMEAEPSFKAVVLTASGGIFSGGFAIREFTNIRSAGSEGESFPQRTGSRHRPSLGAADSGYPPFPKTQPSSSQRLVLGYATASRLADPFRPSQWRLVMRAHAALETYAILQCETAGVLVVGDAPLAVFEQTFLVIARRCAPFISPGFWTMGCPHDV